METKCNDNHIYGQFIEKDNEFIRTCECCGFTRKYPKDEDTTKEYNEQLYIEILKEKIINQDPIITESTDNLLNAIGTLTEKISYIDITLETSKTLIESITTLNNKHNQDNPERKSLINQAIEFIELFLKRKKLQTIGGKNSISEEQSDEFYDKWNELNTSFSPYLAEIYDSKKNHHAR